MSRFIKSINAKGTPMGKGPALHPRYRLISEFCDEVATDFDAEHDYQNVTDRFFQYIEQSSRLLNRYKELEAVIGRNPLNSMMGRWIKDHYGLMSGTVVNAKLSTLIRHYTRFDHVR